MTEIWKVPPLAAEAIGRDAAAIVQTCNNCGCVTPHQRLRGKEDSIRVTKFESPGVDVSIAHLSHHAPSAMLYGAQVRTLFRR